MHRLSPSQSRFVQSQASNIRLLAPAGSGKTYSLLHRARYLIEKSEGTERVLILVFTVGAKDELQKRVNADPLFSDYRDKLLISTLNAWGNKRVKDALGNARLVNSSWNRQELILNNLRSEWVRDDTMRKAFEGRKKRRAAGVAVEGFDVLEGLGFHPSRTSTEEIIAHKAWLREMHLERLLLELENNVKSAKILHKTADIARFIRFWASCTDVLRTSGHYSFSQQKFFPWLELQEKVDSKQVLRGGQRIHHIFVDEFQDISALDANLLRCLREYNDATITIAGDDDQAIYEWRAASVEFILQPEKTFSLPFDTIILEENYRSPRNIVIQAQRLIGNNRRRVQKRTLPQRTEDATIRIFDQESARERTSALFEYCVTTLKNDPSARIALLSRKRSHLLPLQILCAENHLPFHAAEDLNVLFSDSFKNLILVLEVRQTLQIPPEYRKKLGVEHQPAALIRTLVNVILRYTLSKSHSTKLRTHMRVVRNSNVDECLKHLEKYTGPLGYAPNDNGVVARRVADIARNYIDAPTVFEAMTIVAKYFEGMQADYVRGEDDVFHTDPPFEQLVDFSIRYKANFTAFVDALNEAQERHREISKEPSPNAKIFLMTALRAKGAEFDHVVLLECTDGNWPHQRSVAGAQLESERRLFYVAVTRCQKELVFSVEPDESTRSRFIREFMN